MSFDPYLAVLFAVCVIALAVWIIVNGDPK